MAINTTDVNVILDRLDALTRKSRDKTSGVEVETRDSKSSFLRTNDLLGRLPEDELERFIALGRRRKLRAGDWLFEVGEPCRDIHAVVSGIVEIRREQEGEDGRAALLGPGDLIGLLGAFAGGKHRSSAHLPEGGEILCIDSVTFVDSLEKFPAISAALVRDLAGRFMGAVKNADMTPASRRQLEGSLAHFDLAMVLQNLIANDRTAGTLTVLDDSTDAVADVLLGRGRFLACRYGRLGGLAALRQLFLDDLRGYRFFYVESEEAQDAADACESSLGGMTGIGLLMDCARIVDEHRRIMAGPLGNPETRLRRKGRGFAWSDPATLAVFSRLMNRLGEPRSVGQILAKEAASSFEILSILDELIESDAVEILG